MSGQKRPQKLTDARTRVDINLQPRRSVMQAIVRGASEEHRMH